MQDALRSMTSLEEEVNRIRAERDELQALQKELIEGQIQADRLQEDVIVALQSQLAANGSSMDDAGRDTPRSLWAVAWGRGVLETKAHLLAYGWSLWTGVVSQRRDEEAFIAAAREQAGYETGAKLFRRQGRGGIERRMTSLLQQWRCNMYIQRLAQSQARNMQTPGRQTPSRARGLAPSEAWALGSEARTPAGAMTPCVLDQSVLSVTSRIKALEGEVVADEMVGLLKDSRRPTTYCLSWFMGEASREAVVISSLWLARMRPPLACILFPNHRLTPPCHVVKELEAENDELWHKLALARRRVAMQAMAEIRKRWQLAAKATGFRRWLSVVLNCTVFHTESKQSTASITCIQGLRHIASVWGRMSLRVWLGQWAMVTFAQRALDAAEAKAEMAKSNLRAAKERLKATFDFGEASSEARSDASP